MSETAQPAEHARAAAVEAELSGAAGTGIEQVDAERSDAEQVDAEQVDAERSDAERSDAGSADAEQASGDGTPTPTPSTADPRVDDALSRLAEIDGLPLTEQVEVYTDIHRRLAGVLADPDSQA
jgi:hypothetical protein